MKDWKTNTSAPMSERKTERQRKKKAQWKGEIKKRTREEEETIKIMEQMSRMEGRMNKGSGAEVEKAHRKEGTRKKEQK